MATTDRKIVEAAHTLVEMCYPGYEVLSISEGAEPEAYDQSRIEPDGVVATVHICPSNFKSFGKSHRTITIIVKPTSIFHQGVYALILNKEGWEFPIEMDAGYFRLDPTDPPAHFFCST